MLGRLEVRLGRGGEGVELRGTQGKLAFAYLALHRGRGVARSELEEAIWDERPPGDPGAALSTILSRLRASLGAGAIEGRSELRLVLPGATVDVETARAAVERAEREEEPRAALDAASDAIDLLGAELLPGFDAPWIEDVRRELDEARLRALELSARAELQLGDPAAAERSARQLIRALPYREAGHAYLMEALVAQGNSAEALAAYEDLRVILRDELGTAPSRTIAQQHQAVLQGEARGEPSSLASRPAEPEGPPAALRATIEAGPPFVGREAEFDRLAGLFAERGPGFRRLTLIEGDPGIGKTRLCAELATLLAGDGVRVLYGRSEEAALAQYQPFVEALGAWASTAPEGELRAATEGLHEAAELVPQLRRRLPDLPRASGSADRLMVFDEVAELLARASASRPLLLVLDDLHWADEPTLLLLKRLVRSAVPIDCLIVGTYRITEFESPLTEVVAELGREGPFGQFELSGLGESAVAELIAARTGEAATDPVVSEVARRSEGNPFFVSELISEMLGGGAAAGSGIPVSRGAAAMLDRRLRDFDPDELDALSLASVIGRDFTFELLQEAGGGDPERLALLLDRAGAERVAHELPGAVGRYSFDHALIQDYLYHRVGGPRRAQLHLRVAQTLDAISASNPEPYLEQLAHHYAEAAPVGDIERAIEASELAGWRAQALHAHERAAQHFQRALELVGPDGPPARRADLLIALGNCLVKSAHTEDGRAALLQGAQVARTLADGERLAEAALGYADSGGTWSMNTGRSDPELVALLEEALRRLPEDKPGLRGRVSARLATELHWAEDADGRPEALSRDSVDLARKTGDPDLIYRALVDRTVSIWEPHRLDERQELTTEALEWSRRSSDRSAEANAGMWRTLTVAEDAESEHGWEIVDELATQAVEEARNAQLRWVHRQLLVNRAIAEGRLAEAGELVGRMLELAPGSSEDPEIAAAYSGFLITREAGGLAALEAVVDEQLAQQERTPGLAALRMVGAVILLDLGRRDEAEAQLEALGDGFEELRLDSTWSLGVSHAAEVIAELGDAERAERLLGLALDAGAPRISVLGGGVGLLGSMDRYLGLLAKTAGKREEAISHLRRAIEVNDRKNGPVEAAHSRIDLAELLAAEGEAAESAVLLDRAAAFADSNSELVRLHRRIAAARAPVPS